MRHDLRPRIDPEGVVHAVVVSDANTESFCVFDRTPSKDTTVRLPHDTPVTCFHCLGWDGVF